MPRDITVTFDDGTSHVYQGAPDNVTPDAVEQRAVKEFGKKVTALDGGRGTAAPKSLVDQIPDTLAPVGPKPAAPSIGEKVFGAGETALALGTGLVSSAVAPVVGAATTLLSGKYGTPEGVRIGAQRGAKFAEDYTYAPRSETGQQLTSAVNNAMTSAIGATPVLNQFAPLAGPMQRGVRQAVGDTVGTVKDMTKVPEAITSSRAIQASEKAWGNAPALDAAKDAVRLDLAINPVDTNPTPVNKVASVLTGPGAIRNAAHAKNEARLAEIARSETGLSASDALDTAGFKKAMDQATSGSYAEIRKLPALAAPDEVVAKLDALRPDPRIVSEKGVRDRLNALIDDAVERLSEQDGASALKNIQQFRSEANDAFAAAKKGPVTPVELSVAKAKLGLANAFESLIESNLPPESDLIARYRADRTRVAKIATYRTATNVGQGKIDPMTLAAMSEVDNALTGDTAAVSRVINNFPKAFSATPPELAEGYLRRYGPGGIIGGALGGLAGSIPVGVVVGAGAGKLMSNMMANRMASAKYQASHTLPPDPRMPQFNSMVP